MFCFFGWEGGVQVLRFSTEVGGRLFARGFDFIARSILSRSATLATSSCSLLRGASGAVQVLEGLSLRTQLKGSSKDVGFRAAAAGMARGITSQQVTCNLLLSPSAHESPSQDNPTEACWVYALGRWGEVRLPVLVVAGAKLEISGVRRSWSGASSRVGGPLQDWQPRSEKRRSLTTALNHASSYIFLPCRKGHCCANVNLLIHAKRPCTSKLQHASR